MTSMPFTEARNRLSELIDEVERTHERVTITRHGQEVAILLSPDDLASLEETLDVLASPEAMRQLAESREAIEAGDVLDADELAALMAKRALESRVSNRGPHTGYQLHITGPAARALAGRLPEKIATAVHEFITTTLLDNPRRIGKPLLLPPYQGTWSARRGTYRVLYEIDDETHTVTVTGIEHRSDAYRSRG